ncbi:PGPGW domain-containing protein [Candidatus Saccharibacteria bacterium]|nr:PGPGW domain-containing protein [Candidatus Saccharibacteria bacterium]
MTKPKDLLRKLLVLLAGLVVLIVGIILIPLPGPGLLVMFAGLAILALEFEWALKHKKKIQQYLNQQYQKISKKLD